MSIVVLFLNIHRDERFAYTRVCSGRYSDKAIAQKKKVHVATPPLSHIVGKKQTKLLCVTP